MLCKGIAVECQKCKLWDMAAKEAGKAGGMCGECFDKRHILFEPIYDPYSKNESIDNLNAKDGE